MKNILRAAIIGSFLMTSLIAMAAQNPGLLNADDLKKLVPGSYFFAGQSAPVQLRNTVGLRTAEGKLVLAGFVDTSGYAADVASKYQGFFINEVKVSVGGTDLAPGEYGFGFSKDGKFLIMDVGAHDLFSVSTSMDDQLRRPVPLKLIESGGEYRLYAGKKWVALKP